MINRVVLIGRLTRSPELRKTKSGVSTTNFTLAVNRRIQSQGQPDADFINCVAWNKVADTIYNNLHKGSLIGIEGRLQTRSYKDHQNQTVYVTEVVCENLTFLEPKRNGQQQSQGQPYAPQNQPVQQQPYTLQNQQVQQQPYGYTMQDQNDQIPMTIVQPAYGNSMNNSPNNTQQHMPKYQQPSLTAEAEKEHTWIEDTLGISADDLPF